VRLCNEDACQLLQGFANDEATFSYCDPPYLPSTRTAKKAYGAFEMSYEDHELMLDVLKEVKGKVMISGYANELYSRELEGWRQVKIDMANHSGQGGEKQRRVEVVYMNY
jgi:DNA adenine methylase